MDIIETMLARRSVRTFTQEPVTDEELNRILTAALSSPTGKGKYPWELIAIRDADTLEKLSFCRQGSGKILLGAKAAVVVVVDSEKTDTWIEDGSIVMTNMHLAASAIGLGSCWIQGRLRFAEDGEASEKAVQTLLGIPEKYKLVAVLAVGHPADVPAPHRPEDLHTEKIHYEKF